MSIKIFAGCSPSSPTFRAPTSNNDEVKLLSVGAMALLDVIEKCQAIALGREEARDVAVDGQKR